jgi:hypothetical protein
MLNTLKIPLTTRAYFTITGGPSYRAISYPQHTFVKLAKEIQVPCDISIPTKDFGTPDLQQLTEGLVKAVTAVLAGTPLYVGCMAGKGRTGLFLAVLAKSFGVANPVEYVRANYYPHAVETDGQYQFVEAFEVPATVIEAIKKARFKARLMFWKKSLTV